MKYIAIALSLTLLLSSPLLYAQETKSADFDGNGSVDFTDFLMFAQGFGKSDGQDDFNAELDLDGNGTIDFSDFLLFCQCVWQIFRVQPIRRLQNPRPGFFISAI